MFRNQKGSTLVLSLMVLAVCVILGITFISINYGENKQSINEENRLKAYYIARSAAHSTAEWLLNTSNQLNVTQVVPNTAGLEIAGSGTLEGYDFTTSIVRDSGNRFLIIIKGTATIGESSADAIITLSESRIYDGSLPFNNAIFSHANITLTGNTEVIGSIEAGGVVNSNNNVTINGTVLEGSTRRYPPWFLDEAELTIADPYNIQVNTGGTLVVSENSRFGTILVKNGGTIQFVLSGGDLKVMADIVDMKGTMEILGTGTLKFYVNDGSSSQPDFDVSGGVISNSEQLFVYLEPGSKMRLPGGSNFNGFVYGPSATIDLNGTPGFNGAMIAGDVTGVGTSDISYSDEVAGVIDPDEIGVVRFSSGMWVN